jgi:hypothetical protein
MRIGLDFDGVISDYGHYNWTDAKAMNDMNSIVLEK